ncbi:MAG: hypothetical protein JW983_02530 [Elusimicrobia bacterium]|nr:hypothetical protein [Elusimicrobiota bacterium]
MTYIFIFVLGFVSLGFQIILLRECLAIFSGNELIIGIFLANWMLVTGIGSYIAGVFVNRIRNINKMFGYLTFLTGLIMPVEIFFIRFIKQFLQKTPTEILGIIPVLIFTFITVLFVCFLFGIWFVFSANIFMEDKRIKEDVAGRLYAVETAGAVLGGLMVSIIFIRYFNTIQISLIFSFIIFVVLAFFFSKKYYIFAILTVILLFKSDQIEKYSLSYSWKPFNLADSKESIYGRISAVKNENEYDFYENSSKVYSTILSAADEEITHIPILLLSDCNGVLVIGGGGNSIREVLKHPVGRVTYIEPDPVLLGFLKKYSGREIKKALNDERLEIIGTDGRFFTKKTEQRFDCVIINVSAPMTGLSNRYFTYEFFKEIRSILSGNGIVIFPVLSSENYMSEELKLLSASIYNTAIKIFDYCYIVPASNNYFIYSIRDFNINPLTNDKTIDVGIKPGKLIARIKTKEIKTRYLTPYYLKYILRTDRVKRLTDWITEKKNIALLNSDFYPVCYLYGLNYWISYFGKTLPEKILLPAASGKFAVVLILIYIILIIFFVKIKKYVLQTIVIVVSCVSIILEFLIIFAFQSSYGYLYYKIGILLSLCLLGIGIGSYVSDKTLVRRENVIAIIKTIISCMVLFSCMLPFIFRLLSAGTCFTEPFFYFLISFAGFFIGSIYPLAVKKHDGIQEVKIGKFYGFDLLGAMFGSTSATLVFIPLFGISNTCFIIAFFVFLLIFLVK